MLCIDAVLIAGLKSVCRVDYQLVLKSARFRNTNDEYVTHGWAVLKYKLKYERQGV
jgi:hypothetical protein